MKAECPNCGTIYHVDGSKISDKGAYATCAKCRTRFYIEKQKADSEEFKEETITCPNCGHQQPKSAECEKCGNVFSKYYEIEKKKKQEAESGLAECKACGKKISKNAKFCPHCGELSPTRDSGPRERKGGCDEEEKVRINPKRIVLGTIIGIGITVALMAIVLGVSIILDTEDTPKTPEINIHPSVSFTGTQFVITNKDNFDWTNIKLEVNPRGLSSGYTLRLNEIKAGTTYTVGAMQFAKDGNRFNPWAKKVERFHIYCKTYDGYKSWIGEWK